MEPRPHLVEGHLVFTENTPDDAIEAAVNAAYTVGSLSDVEIDSTGRQYELYSCIYLTEPEEAFVSRVRDAIWEAAGCFVEIVLFVTPLYDLPRNEYRFTEAEYRQSKA